MTGVVLSRLLQLEQAASAADGAGGLAESWQVLGQLWAEVVPGSGREARGEELYAAATPFRITVRGAPVGATARPRPGQRFRDGARLFRILAVTERDAQGAFLLCRAQEEVPA